MDALGIQCKTVTGTGNGGSHMWNMVKIGGKWYHVDVTWDDPVPDTPGSVSYQYFLVDDSAIAGDHSWNSSAYPSCSSSNNKFISLLGTVCTTEAELTASFKQQQKEGVTYYSAIVPEGSTLKVTKIFMKVVLNNKIGCYYREPFNYGKYTVYIQIWSK